MKLKLLPRIRLPSGDALEDLIKEACLVAGFLAVARGLWLMHPPTMWVVCGVMLLYVGMPPRAPKQKGG